MRQREFRGSVARADGGTVESGRIVARPRPHYPTSGATALMPDPATYQIVNGQIAVTVVDDVVVYPTITGGTNYTFELYSGDVRNPVWRFDAGVPDVDGDPPLTWGALVASIGTPAINTRFVEDSLTEETDTALVLAPDGTGGVEFRPETGGGGGGTYIRTYTWVLGAGTPVTTGTDKTNPLIVERACVPVKVLLNGKTGPTGADFVVDINAGGTSLWSTTQDNRPKIIAGATTGTQTAFDDTTLAEGDVLTIDVNQVGSTVAGQDITVQLVCEVATT